jgi:hypothetical protein
LCAALLGAAPATGAGAAEEAGKPVPLQVTAGYSGYGTAGRSIPVAVTVDADRLLAGDLVVRSRTGSRVSMPVEVPGGSVKRFTVVLPTNFGGDDLITATVVDGDRTLAKGEHRVSMGEGTELVGLLPEVLAGRNLPGPAPLSVDAGTARFVRLPPADIISTAALDPLSAIGARFGELEALPARARDALAGWLASGGQLLIDDEPTGPLEGLPAEWTPTGGSTRARAGQGAVRLTAGRIAGFQLAGLVDPTNRTGFSGGFGGDGVAQTVARDAGLRLPKITTLLGFLGLYVLAVGPVTAMVLRRKRRPELAWVAVPALALVFTLLAYGAGSRTRSRTNLGHGTVVMVDGASSVALSYIGVTHPGRGEARVNFPAGWSVQGDMNTGRAAPAVELGRDGPEAVLPLAVGEFGLVKAEGPMTLPGDGLEVTATVDAAGKVDGKVRNRLPFSLDEVTVFAGGGEAEVGHLDPGEERTWSFEADKLPRFNNGDWRPDAPWFQRSPGDWSSNGHGPAGRNGVVNLPLWQEIRAELGPDERAPGLVTAVGWTRDFKPEFRIDGRNRSLSGRTAVVVRNPLEAAPGTTAPAFGVRREILRGSFPSFFGKFFGPAGPFGDETVLRFTLPAGANPDATLELESSTRLRSIEVWQDGVWKVVKAADGTEQQPGGGGVIIDPKGVPVPMPVPTAPPPRFPGDGAVAGPGFDASKGIELPSGVVKDGVVFVRVRLGEWMGNDISLTLGEPA